MMPLPVHSCHTFLFLVGAYSAVVQSESHPDVISGSVPVHWSGCAAFGLPDSFPVPFCGGRIHQWSSGHHWTFTGVCAHQWAAILLGCCCDAF